jgi:hypothetical protein
MGGGGVHGSGSEGGQAKAAAEKAGHRRHAVWAWEGEEDIIARICFIVPTFYHRLSFAMDAL